MTRIGRHIQRILVAVRLRTGATAAGCLPEATSGVALDALAEHQIEWKPLELTSLELTPIKLTHGRIGVWI